MRSLRLGVAALLVGVSSACSVLGGDDAAPPSGVADDLAAALSAHEVFCALKSERACKLMGGFEMQ